MKIGFPTHLCLWSVQWTWDMLCACDLCSGHGTPCVPVICVVDMWHVTCCVPVICAVDMGFAACPWSVQWTWDLLRACDLCSAGLTFFKLQKFRASAFLITGRKHSIFNWRPLSWPYMEMSGEFCGPLATGMWGCGRLGPQSHIFLTTCVTY